MKVKGSMYIVYLVEALEWHAEGLSDDIKNKMTSA